MARPGTFAKGNPGGGRPKNDPAVVKALAALTKPAIAKLQELLQCGDQRVEMRAVEVVLERNLGKVPQPVSADGPGNVLVMIGREFDAK